MRKAFAIVLGLMVVAAARCSRGTLSAYDAPPGIRVMTFNIQHGIDGGQRYRLQTSIDTIARINPDIVALVELTRNHPFYNCDDQPKMMADGLTQATGRRWTFVYRQQWFTPNKECVN